MATYVMSDLHGCYDEFREMLKKISFCDDDRLIVAGDYVDRGTQSYELLRFMLDHPANMTLLLGNHDEEFAAYVDLMAVIDAKENLQTDCNDHDDMEALFETTEYFFRTNRLPASMFFDYYGTVSELSFRQHVTFGDFLEWRDRIRKMPLYEKLEVNGRQVVVVHAGYREGLSKEDLKEFCLYARKTAYKNGGIPHGMVVAGHTPTIAEGEFTFTGGKVFRHYDGEQDCIFYDIDCGCVFRKRYGGAALACIRLEDEAIFYV